MITNNHSWSLGPCSNKSFEPDLRSEIPVRPLHPGDHSFPISQSNCVHSLSNFPVENLNASRTLNTDKKRLKRINTDNKRLTLVANSSAATIERLKRLFGEKTRISNVKRSSRGIRFGVVTLTTFILRGNQGLTDGARDVSWSDKDMLARSLSGILVAVPSLMLTASDLGAAETNEWTKATDGKWEEPFWSLGK